MKGIITKISAKVRRCKFVIKKDKLLNTLIDNIKSITEVESDIYNYVNNLEEIEWRIRDILHYLEVTPISRSGAIVLMEELQKLRIERRYIKQMWEIWNTYGANRAKLQEKSNRDFLIAELNKKDKSLQTTYNYRFFTKEELDKMNEDKNLPRKRKVEILNMPKSYNNIKEEEDGKE